MRYCTKCVLPDTHETIQFDEGGVCNICQQAERKHTAINWAERQHWGFDWTKVEKGKLLHDAEQWDNTVE